MFQGREYFAELGIYDYRNRFYHPVLGRFLQIDPIGFAAGDMNLFRYCGDDPVNRVDPTGLASPSVETWQRQMLWQAGSDGTTGEQLALLYEQESENGSQVGRSGVDANGRQWRGLTNDEGT